MASVTAPTATTQSQPQAEFVKAMTLTDATMLVAGSMIGSGIFIVPADMARKRVAPGYLFLAWMLAGVTTVLGALALVIVGIPGYSLWRMMDEGATSFTTA